MSRVIGSEELLARLCKDNGILYSEPRVKNMVAADHLREQVKFNPEENRLNGVNIAYIERPPITDQYGNVKIRKGKDKKYHLPY